ncbi:hypothetical protein DYB32_002221 [Aphanomyces invadans]|uniref:Calcineurin-like phosphoesterase domain-containing protein n=1 Tax=Aphanomyces invadans TaxID=157072 RepID=A0A3R7ACY7_9STRA|nr:hypothetical protein DYB32_002221 [Aphanomyces invadans]
MRLSECMLVLALCGWCVYILSYFITSTSMDITRALEKKSKSKALAAQLHDPPKLGSHVQATLGFVVMGDYGTGTKLQAQVATSLGDFVDATQPRASFVLSTGDQIYDHGLLSADDPAVISKFEKVLRSFPWYRGTSGERYYHMDHRIDNSTIVRFVVLDACDLVCGQESPEFKDFRCTPNMDAQTSIASRRRQYEWMENVLRMDPPKAVGGDADQLSKMWTVVVGHWAVYSFAGNGDTPELISNLVPLLEKYNVHAYFNGHDHAMQHVRKGTIQYFTSGAGGYALHDLKPRARAHPELVHVDTTNGFMWVQVSHDTFRVQFVDGTTTEILYTTDVPYRVHHDT